MAASNSIEPRLFLNPIFTTSTTTNSSTSLHIQNFKLKLPHFPTKNPTLVFTLNSSSGSATTNNNNDNTIITPYPDDPDPEPVSAVSSETRTRDGRDRRKIVKVAWDKLVRWSRTWRSKAKTDILERTNKVVVLGGGSFGTAMAAHVANRKAQLKVYMLMRDPVVCQSINEKHCNCRYFPEQKLPENVIATTDAKTALLGADYCLHAVPVQFSSSFLEGISDYVDPGLPFISLSKGLELNTLRMMSQIIPQALRNPRQPFIALSGPSFALELMNKLPTAMVVASKDRKLANAVQQLLASKHLRISTSRCSTFHVFTNSRVFTLYLYQCHIGVEIAGALKNVLAIAAGIVVGMNLGNNSMAALVAQGCSEIRWLATKMGAKPATITGLSGTGDIMLTCFVNLSRNRTVGVRLGSGEKLDDILSSMNQVAEGVSTAGAVIALAQKYNVKMPVLTAVARIIDNELTPKKAVLELMSLPQVEEV
ncbi:glycerol-3-phosphate dehydrogenase (NAD(+)) 2 [Citrus sinensis]|nr:glycerol-3-phosphate dehydrogenase (NAD(+)) 2 [Citrus sinensis]